MQSKARIALECGPKRARGFTIVELLMVIAIIAILVGLSVAVAARVSQNAKAGYTQNVIQVLDQAYASWSMEKQAKAPKFFVDDEGTQFPIIDATSMMPPPPDPKVPVLPESSLSFLLASITDSNSAESMLTKIDTKLIYRFDPKAKRPDGTPVIPKEDNPLNSRALGDIRPMRSGSEMNGIAINDAWGKRLRVVVPAYQGGFGDYFNPVSGAGMVVSNRSTLKMSVKLKEKLPGSTSLPLEFRRSYLPLDPRNPTPSDALIVGDADEGLCSGATPYFYSAGPDGDPGTRGDNVYSHKPAYPPETSKFNN